MDLVDKQHITGFQAGQHRRQITRTLQYRPRRTLYLHAHFLGHDIRQGSLAQPRRAEDQQVVQRFTPPPGSGHEQLHLLAYRRLTYIVGQPVGADGPVDDFFLLPGPGSDQTVFFQHRASRVEFRLRLPMFRAYQPMPFKARRISSSLLRPSSLMALTARLASCGL